MRTNRVRDIWEAGGNVVNGWLASSCSYSAEVMAVQGFDSIGVDLQHGMIDYNQSIAILQAISGHQPTPLARIPWNDPTWIMKVLDAGALGLICPMVNSAEEAAAFVGACRYPPRGFRSFAGVRGPLYVGSDYRKVANELIVTLPMIETKEALDRIEEIVKVEGVDAVYIGPSDLALGLGFDPVADPVEKVVLEAIEHIRRVAVDAGVKPCIHSAGGDHARRLFQQGFRLCSISNDMRLMSIGATSEIKAARA
ncbi:MAG: aldolase/citrate lyase family protein [Pseudomonadota bacterium]|nr:aldolase/citrate lyase family protein [Pseudomonadota bacterium]